MGFSPQYGKPSRGETGRGLAVILVLALGVAIGAVVTMFMVLNPPSSPPAKAPSQGADHSETSVRQAVQPALDAYGSGSYGDFWDLWTAGAQQLISREEYVRLFTLCPPIVADSPFTIASVAVTGDTALVQATRAGGTTEFGFVFEGGSWRYEPPRQEREEYRKPVDQLAAERRTAGFCGTALPDPGTAPTSAPQDPGTAPTSAPQDPGTGSTSGPTSGTTSAPTSAPPIDPGQGVPGRPMGFPR
ncbi:hypothetical protein [Streptosporangium longisporum]|uniref:DUF4878 domain-containing protein n=1 Tax=Streptosporangium longisporum TaxID=46187 RepID=A0ABP6KC06_9ACTN